MSKATAIIKQKVSASISFASSTESSAELILHPAKAVKKAQQLIIEQKKTLIEKTIVITKTVLIIKITTV